MRKNVEGLSGREWPERRAILSGLLVLGAALTTVRVRALQQTARVIFVTIDGPLRDDVLSGPNMTGFRPHVRMAWAFGPTRPR